MNCSVIIPCYNRERSLRAAIESALGQTVPPVEVIVVDDGSVDASAALAEGFGPPVRVIRTENRGSAAARNRGIGEARCDWIAFLDSDDIWAPDKLSRQARAVEVFPEADLVFCDTRVREAGRVQLPSRFGLGGLCGKEVARQDEFALYDRSLFLGMLEQSRCITSAVMVRRALPDLLFPEHIWGSEDWALWLKLALRHRFASVGCVLVTMYTTDDNLTRNTSRLMRNDVLALQDLLNDLELTEDERASVQQVLQKRRIAAVYHSLVHGETREARNLLADIPRHTLPGSRWLCYWLASLIPGGFLRTLSQRRLKSGCSAAVQSNVGLLDVS